MVDRVVRTERLELVDRRGRTRAVLACEEDSEAPSCAFLDADGQTRVIVGISWNEMPQIQLTAPDGTARVALIVRREGMGMVVLMDDQQRSKTITPTDPGNGVGRLGAAPSLVEGRVAQPGRVGEGPPGR